MEIGDNGMSTDTTDNAPGEDRPNEKGSQEFTPQIAFALGTINGSVENLRTDLKEWKDDTKDTLTADRLSTQKQVDGLDARIRSLEQWKWTIAGAAAAGGLAGGKLLEILGKLL